MTDTILMHRMKANTAGWPQAAAEHARLLALQINALNSDGSYTRKAHRLINSLGRLQKRYMVLDLPRRLR